MAIVGSKRFPTVNGHAAPGAVTLAKRLVALRLGDNLFKGPPHTAQRQFVQYVRHHVRAECFHAGRGGAADQLWEITFPQIAFQRIEAGDAQQGRVQKAVDHIEGWNVGSAPCVGQTRKKLRQGKHQARILLKLVKFAARVEDPWGDGGGAELPARDLVVLPAAAFVLEAAATGTRMIAIQPRGKDSLGRTGGRIEAVFG